MEPQITPSYYTTSDAVISTETVFIVEILLMCKNRVQVRLGGAGSGAAPCQLIIPRGEWDSNSEVRERADPSKYLIGILFLLCFGFLKQGLDI